MVKSIFHTQKVLFLSMILILCFSSVAFAYKSSSYPIRPDKNGAYDGVYIDVYKKSNAVVTFKAYGVHTGQSAHIKFVLYNANSDVVFTKDLGVGDVDGFFTLKDLAVGRYQLMWESLTSNETNGYFYVTMDDGAGYVFQ
ncbi:hypothetical protein D7Z26_06785 [Cohnella endophytica]|uniref:Copper resistance protein CopC n=1 Tax=Cohnella endophytica TaxID=2419778 RepID=A0A494Y4T6_9BACL|nr:hypothetical protein [Cohnella endophytica]RKP54940.1 hypothetical protein D7Z26_06785 [Cohnella endophytica]